MGLFSEKAAGSKKSHAKPGKAGKISTGRRGK
jgi:hypothetical protein